MPHISLLYRVGKCRDLLAGVPRQCMWWTQVNEMQGKVQLITMKCTWITKCAVWRQSSLFSSCMKQHPGSRSRGDVMIGVWRGWLSGTFSHQMLAETTPVQAGGLNSALVQVAANDDHHKWGCSVNWLWYELKQNTRTTTTTCHLYKGHATCIQEMLPTAAVVSLASAWGGHVWVHLLCGYKRGH